MLTVRAASAEDWPFIRELFFEVKAPLFAPARLTEDELRSLLKSQFEARTRDYALRRPKAEYEILEQDGCTVGMAIVNREREISLMDIAIKEDARNQGIGTAYLERLIEEADSGQRDITLYVEPENPARRLYQRFGFATETQDQVNCFMRRRPRTTDKSSSQPGHPG